VLTAALVLKTRGGSDG